MKYLYRHQRQCKKELVHPIPKLDGNQTAKIKNANFEEKISLGDWQIQVL